MIEGKLSLEREEGREIENHRQSSVKTFITFQLSEKLSLMLQIKPPEKKYFKYVSVECPKIMI